MKTFMNLPNSKDFDSAFWSWQSLKTVATDINSKEMINTNFRYAVVTYWDEAGDAYVERIKLLEYLGYNDKSMAGRVSAGHKTQYANTRIPDTIIVPSIKNHAEVMEKLRQLNLINA